MLNLDMELETTDTNFCLQTKALVDSGAAGSFINAEYANQNVMKMKMEERLEMDLIEGVGVQEWVMPQMKKQVQFFLRFCNFYQRFIVGFSQHARPLFDLTKKDAPFQWGAEEQRAFDKLKDTVTMALVLTMPDSKCPF